MIMSHQHPVKESINYDVILCQILWKDENENRKSRQNIANCILIQDSASFIGQNLPFRQSF